MIWQPSQAKRSAVWCVVLVAAALAACASAPPPVEAPPQETARATAPAAPAALPAITALPPASDTQAPSALVWASSSALHVGFRDGVLATVDVEGGRVEVRRLGTAPVAAISGDGRLAVVAAQPVVLYDTRSGEGILHFPDVKGLYSARFAPQGDFLVVAESSGRMHVWSRDQLRPGPKGETLTALMGRQNPAMSARFAPLSGAIAVTPRGEVVFGDREGHVSTWSIEQQQTFRLMRLEGAPWSMAGTDRFVIAASKEGRLGASAAGSPRFEPWSQQAQGRFVAAPPDRSAQEVVVVGDADVALLDPATGEARWRRPHAAQAPCGASLGSGAQRLAACLDGAVVVLDARGATLGTLRYAGGELRWMDAQGAVKASVKP